MLPLYKLVLGPVLLIQARRLKRTALRLPEAAGPRCGSEGLRGARQPALRILVVGDSSAAGVGVDDQAQALAQPVAKLLAIKLGRPVTWQLVAKSGVNTEESLALLRQSELGRADFLVTALGTNDVTSQRAPRQFLQDYRRLVEEVRRRTGVVGLVATGLPPLRILPAAQHPLRWYLGRYAARLDRMLQRWIDQDAAARYIYRLIGQQSRAKWPVIDFTPGLSNIVVGLNSSASKSWTYWLRSAFSNRPPIIVIVEANLPGEWSIWADCSRS